MNTLRKLFLYLNSGFYLIFFSGCSYTPSKNHKTSKNNPEKMTQTGLRDGWEYVKNSPYTDQDCILIVNIAYQKIVLLKEMKIQKIWPVSTSKYGISRLAGSGGTPTGLHKIEKKYGANRPPGAVFKSRRYTGRQAEIYTEPLDTEDDLVTSRILHLKGLEPGVNSGQNYDSYKRCIYIHGTPEEGLIGTPASHGCIRMRNEDVIELFEIVPVNTFVDIQEN